MMRASILCSIVSACSALAAPADANKFQLKYFDIKGAAEGSRLLFAIAGEDYDDARFAITPGTMKSPAFDAAKESGDLAMNLDRAPVLVTPDGATIGQSKAMERYLARRFGLMGETDEDAAAIDCLAEHCRDVKDAQIRKRFSAFVKDRSDEEKARDQAEWFDNEMPAMLAKIEASVRLTSKAKGCAFGSSLSYADVCIYQMLKETFPAYADATLTAAKDCPLLLEICEGVATNPGVKKWIESRPDSPF